ncbi:hypothetical protein J4G33_14635 [Actinotalea sp. BY-33]|uniref:Uncharacterized protein n=1 Tax=Actinotalea soli TaxID=2819234 RepID=A0A939LR94_9CELL|nr:hypothetical protein [Actinotalea soli]MBO1753046.1 hypothetical protein [Actinotalea soli]
MKIDLEQALNDMARSVQDDAAADRMHGRVRQMVTIVRRRRAARHTAVGMVGVGAAAALAFGGLQLADVAVDEPVPPAAPSERIERFACGAEVRTTGISVTAPDSLDHEPTVMAGGSLQVDFDVEASDTFQTVGTPTYTVALVQDDLVVSDPVRIEGRAPTADAPTLSANLSVTACGTAAALPRGGYQVVVFESVEVGEQPTVHERLRDVSLLNVYGEAVPTPDPDEDAAGDENFSEEETAALITLNELVSYGNEDPTATFPQCGTTTDSLDDGMPPLALEMDLDLSEADAEGAFTGTVMLRTTEGRRVTGTANASGASLVLLRDGVVVGHEWLDPWDLVEFDLQDGEAQELPLLGARTLCGTGGTAQPPALRLPPGEYEAMAWLEVTVEEVAYPGQDPETVAGSSPAWSSPQDIELR